MDTWRLFVVETRFPIKDDELLQNFSNFYAFFIVLKTLIERVVNNFLALLEDAHEFFLIYRRINLF